MDLDTYAPAFLIQIEGKDLSANPWGQALFPNG